MKDFLAWEDKIALDAEAYKQLLVDEALRESKSYDKAIDHIKGLKQGFVDGYQGTVKQASINLMNVTCEMAIREIYKKALSKEPEERVKKDE